MQHHAFVIEAEIEEGVKAAEEWTAKELGIDTKANPDMVVLRYSLFSVEDARRVGEVAMQAPLRGTSKVLIIAASRLYHEAQNALLKLFEEPPEGTYLFLVLPTLGSLLPTLRSRVQILKQKVEGKKQEVEISEVAEEFMRSNKEKRSALIKKLSSGKDEEERREHRDVAIAIVNGIEAVLLRQGIEKHGVTLGEIATLRGYLYDRSAPVRMILEHLSLVIPEGLRL